jgi:predicted regulator of Ras-like GTPase activity (Roadblock/LC7/MglB family)
MSDSFQSALSDLVRAPGGLEAAALTDLDGEDIAVTPRIARDNLRLSAAYGGISLKRLGQIEAAAGRAPVTRISMSGTRGRFVSLRVANDYQLVALSTGERILARCVDDAQNAARTMAESL